MAATEGLKPLLKYVIWNVCGARLEDELEETVLELLDDEELRELDDPHWRISHPHLPSGSFLHEGPPMEPSWHCQLGIIGAGPQSCGVQTPEELELEKDPEIDEELLPRSP